MCLEQKQNDKNKLAFKTHHVFSILEVTIGIMNKLPVQCFGLL
jgi:hypothetical protein